MKTLKKDRIKPKPEKEIALMLSHIDELYYQIKWINSVVI